MHLSFDIGYTFIHVVHQKVHFSLNEISDLVWHTFSIRCKMDHFLIASTDLTFTILISPFFLHNNPSKKC